MAETSAGRARVQADRRCWTLGLPQLWALVAVAGIWIVLNLTLVRPHDFWWHSAAGDWIVEHGRVPGVDLFSYTRLGELWTYQAWVMEVLFYLLLRLGGLPSVIFFHAAVITAAYGLLLQVSRLAAGRDLRWAAAATLTAAVVGLDNWNVRPQTISLLLFAVTLVILEHQRASPFPRRNRLEGGAVWMLPPFFALWANAHGGFVFGLALLGTHLLAEILGGLRHDQPLPRRLLLVTVLCIVATVLTPMGPGVIDYVFSFLRHPVTRSLNIEFMPPTVRELGGQLLFGFGAVLAMLLVGSRYRPSLAETLRLLVFGALALLARRNTIWFGFVAAPTLAASLHEWSASRGKSPVAHPVRSRLNLAIAALVGVLAIVSLPWLRPYLPLPAERRVYTSAETPVVAVEYLRTLAASQAGGSNRSVLQGAVDHLSGPSRPLRVFHGEAYGSFMIWACPEIPVFVDTRIELYPAEQWQDYLALAYARYDWESILARYEIDTLFLARDGQALLIEAAGASGNWAQVYEDEVAAILVHAAEP